MSDPGQPRSAHAAFELGGVSPDVVDAYHLDRLPFDRPLRSTADLMDALGKAAYRKGVTRFTATMLADNRPVVDFVHRTAPAARLHFDGTELAMDLPLLRRPA